MKVLVIGSGILGASVAHHFAQRDVDVTMVSDPAHTPATFGSFGWINANGPDDPHYFRLRMQGTEAWHQWAADIPDLPVQLQGGLDWDLDVEASFAAYQSLGQPCDLLDRAQIAQRFPNLGQIPDQAIFNRREGLADPDKIAQVLRGSLSEIEASVIGFQTTGDRITGVVTDQGALQADHVVLAVGLQSEAMLQSLDMALPMQNETGILFRTNAVPAQFPQVISTPGLHFWQLPDGTLIAGEDLGGKDVGNSIPDLKARIAQKLQMHLPNAGPISLSEMRTTKRPMPADARPAVGRLRDGLSVVCTHSGITLAPLIGRSIVSEVLNDKPLSEMERYTPLRFQS